MNSISFIHVLLKSLIILFSTIASLSSAAEWSGALRSGYSYTDNLGSQLTMEQGLGTSDVESRSGWANQGNLVLQTLNVEGGQALEIFGLYDKSIDTTKDISNLVLSANVFRSFSTNWLWRLSGYFNSYRYDPASISSNDGYGANLTFGYFGNNKQGLDITLAWKYEDHNQSELEQNQYRTNRMWLNLLYYLPREKNAVVWSIQGHVRRNNADNNIRDYSSYLLGLGAGNWKLGKVQGFAGVQWRSNYYDNPVISSTNVNNDIQSSRSHNGPSGNMPGGPGSGEMGGGNDYHPPITSSEIENDQLLSAIFNLTYLFSKHWSARLSADASLYTNSTGRDENLYSVFAGLQWNF